MQRIRGKNLVYLLLAIVPLLSCSSINAQRMQFVRAHPELPIDRQNAVMNGEIISDMSMEEVKAALGTPVNTVNVQGIDGRQISRWIYFKHLGPYTSVYEVRFYDGKAGEVISDGYMVSHTSGAYSGARISQ